MNFDSLVKYIKLQNCRVRIYKKKRYIENSGGTFKVTSNGPLINIATCSHSLRKITAILLHEYGHFLQHKCGFLNAIDSVCDAYDVHYEWIYKNIKFTSYELKTARNAMLWLEHDAEIRGYEAGLKLGVKFQPKLYIKSALGYMISIKWSWINRSDWKMSVQPSHITTKNPTFLSYKKLFAPLTTKEKKLCRYIMSD